MSESGKSVCILHCPPRHSTVRVDLMILPIQEAVLKMEKYLQTIYNGDEDMPSVSVHPEICDLLLIESKGPVHRKPKDLEVYVDRLCGAAVMRGADIFSPGILGSSRGFAKGEMCSIWMDLESQCLRGRKEPYLGARQFLGNAELRVSRNDVFNPLGSTKALKGLGCVIKESVWGNPNLGQMTEDWAHPQNLPSLLCVHVLDPQPGEQVLDLCAAPGGKTLHIASKMQNRGRVMAVDVSKARLATLADRVKSLGLSCVSVFPINGLRCVDKSARPGWEPLRPPFPPESFDRVLVDAPCSARGQRPLLSALDSAQFRSYPSLQQALLDKAVALLKPGGRLVFSTCTLVPEENETNVRYLLDKWPNIHLLQQKPRIVPSTNSNECRAHLSLEESECIQKFDPRQFCRRHLRGDCQLQPWFTESSDLASVLNTSKSQCLTSDQDTIGFFIAAFEKDNK